MSCLQEDYGVVSSLHAQRDSQLAGRRSLLAPATYRANAPNPHTERRQQECRGCGQSRAKETADRSAILRMGIREWPWLASDAQTARLPKSLLRATGQTG